MTITALPALDRTGCAGTGWHKQLLPAGGFVLQVRGRWHHPCLGWKQLCPAALSRLAHVGLAACSPDAWLWLAALGCSSSLRTARKWKEDIQSTDRAKPRCDEASHHTHASLNGKRDGGDRAWWGRVGSTGDSQLKGHRMGTQARVGQVGSRAGMRAVCGPVSCCAQLNHLSRTRGHREVQSLAV